MKIRYLVLILLFFSAGPPLSAGDNPLTAESTPDGILIQEAGIPILHYQQKPKSIEGKYERSNYIHPLYDLDGRVITEDFPADHLHQRGIFWTWHQIKKNGVSLGDGWECRDIKWDVVSAEAVNLQEGGILLKTRVLWKSPNLVSADGEMIPFVEERAEITVRPKHQGERIIDFKLIFSALTEDISIGGSEDEKGYGGFSTRFLLPADVAFRGVEGQVTPRTTALAAGPVIDISGSWGGEGPSGITIIQHPSNPGNPQTWILRSSKSMQNPVYPGARAIAWSPGKNITLRYRLVLRQGGRPDLERSTENYFLLNERGKKAY